MKTALLISTYNWPEALELVLKSLIAQTVLPDEVLIADDGSRDETKALITKFKKESTLNINHVWHEDSGFRRTVILNKAIASTNADYIIQLDGDCIMHSNFIGDHIKNATVGIYLFGSRVNLTEELSAGAVKDKQIDFSFFTKGMTRRTRNIYLPKFGAFYKAKKELSKKVRGCNLSFWREDFLKINGYNEDMTGWGREDSEMVIRLLNNDIYGKRLRYQGIIYHLWHPQAQRERDTINYEIQLKAEQQKLQTCENGIDKYLP